MPKKLFISLICLWQLFLASTAVAEEPHVMGEAAILVDAKTGQILYQKNAHKRMYPASTTKMLTALVALERGNLDEVVTVSERASNIEGSSIWLQPGEHLTLEDLLYALMLNSANDAAVAIAQHLAGTVEQFSSQLNEAAAGLGAKDTHFTNPHGLPDDEHYTTAYDLAIIACYGLKNEKFVDIVSTKNRIINRESDNDFNFLKNHNRLLDLYDGAIGIKTGYTSKAQQCIVAAARRDNRELIAVVLKTQGQNIWYDAINLFNYGFNNFEPHLLITKGEVITKAKVKYSDQPFHLIAAEDVYFNFAVGHHPNLLKNIELAPDSAAPINKGDVLGQLVLYDGNNKLKKINLVADRNVERPLKTHWWFYPLVGLVAAIMLRVLYRYIYKIKMKRLVIRRKI